MSSTKDPLSDSTVFPYTTDCYAEFYDLWTDSFLTGQWGVDAETYWSAILSLLESRQHEPNRPINIIEIGCGSGRTLKELFQRFHDTGVALPNVHFYAIDPSAPMLKRAKAWFDHQLTLKDIASIEWIEGFGENFTEQIPPQLRGAIDLVIWTGGGFSHLCSTDQQLAFFRQMHLALRDDSKSATATGIVSVLNQSIPSRITPAASEIYEVPWEGRRADDPSILYRKSANSVSWEGPVRRDQWDIAILKDGREIHREKVNHTVMNIDEEKWPDLVREAGLRVEKQTELEGTGVFFFLKKSRVE